MCGISCCVSLRGSRVPSKPELQRQLDASLEIIKHRGPDYRGSWISDDSRIALGHVRLSINDLSPSGTQPFHSSDGNIHAVINGEIYGHEEIRAELQGRDDFHHRFQSHSDCEIVIALYQYYGLNFLDHLRGEFSLCLWDAAQQLFVAARDRYGIKPLFYTVDEAGRLLVGAEIKAFIPLGWKAEWDVKSILDGGSAYDDRTDFRGVRKIRPGHYLLCKSHSREFDQFSYWDMKYPDMNIKEPRSEQELIEGVRERLIEAVRLRLRADVPVGVYLSGGIDSSAIAGIMTHLVRERGEQIGNEKETSRVSCFTIAFDEDSGFDESAIANRTADFLNVKFYKKHMSESEIAARFEEATWHCEHINADLNYVGKFALSELPPSLGFKVVLTGEGADEHFAGYPMYLSDHLRQPDPSWPASAQVPESQREALCTAKDKEIEDYYHVIGADGSARTSKASVVPRRMLNNITTVASLLAFSPASLLAPWIFSRLGECNGQMTIANSLSGQARSSITARWHPLHSGMYVWSKTVLANNLLSCLGDRSEMAHSLEGRTPFLDHKLTEYVNHLPPSVKLRYTERSSIVAQQQNGTIATGNNTESTSFGTEFTSKWILREAVKPFVTPELYARKKHPFTAPTTYAVEGPLHKLFRSLITSSAIQELGFVDWEKCKDLVRRAFEDKEILAMRFVIMLGQWIILSRRFAVRRADERDYV